jgi:hypothetical protein
MSIIGPGSELGPYRAALPCSTAVRG